MDPGTWLVRRVFLLSGQRGDDRMRLILGMAAALLLGALTPASAGALDIGRPAPEIVLTD